MPSPRCSPRTGSSSCSTREHDWLYILDTLNLLEKDLSIGRAVHLLGVVLYALAIVGGVRTAGEEPAES